MKNKQEIALFALLKRIQRDRNEQLLHRKIDSKRIIQRSKNLIQHLQKKQSLESRKTKDFLQFSLGTRAPAKKQNSKSRSQSTKKTRVKRIQAMEMSHNIKDPESFFVTERESHNFTSKKESINKSLHTNKLKKNNRSISVKDPRIIKRRISKSKQIEKNNAYHNQSEYIAK